MRGSLSAAEQGGSVLVGEMPTHFPVPPTSNRIAAKRPAPSNGGNAAAFRSCFERYSECLEYQNLRTSSSAHEMVNNYMLDFELASKRAFGNDSLRYRLFQLYFIEGRSAEFCSKELRIERFTLTSEIAQIEGLAGQSFTERGLFPLSSYFGGERTGSNQEQLAA